LLLAQASDWAFIMTTGTSPGYATERTVRHLANLWALRRAWNEQNEPAELSDMEWRNPLF